MDWIKWLIPGIAIAVWILSQLLANQQRQQPPGPPRPQPPRDPEEEARRRRRAADEAERHREELRRRRQTEEEKDAEPIYIAEEIPPRPVPRPLPIEQRRKSVPITNKPISRRREPVIVVEPLPMPPAPKTRSVYSEMQPPPPPQATQALPPPPIVPQVLHGPESLKASMPPAASKVRELLRNRQSLRAAILLREILDPPLCKRRR